jgi:hypothetical protein
MWVPSFPLGKENLRTRKEEYRRRDVPEENTVQKNLGYWHDTKKLSVWLPSFRGEGKILRRRQPRENHRERKYRK